MSDPLFVVETPFDGRTAKVVLRLAPWGEIGGIALSPLGAPAPRLEMQFDTGVRASIAAVDGKPLFGTRTAALLASPQTLAPILERRFDLYERVRAAGRFFAQCPRCGDDMELALLALFNTLGQRPPDPISADFRYFLPPVVGSNWPAPARPDAVYAARIRFELPTSCLRRDREGPASGTLVAVDHQAVADAMRRVATDGVNAPIGRAWWTDDSHAFRATLRLAAALRDLSPAATATPELLVRMAAVDVYFLDALYWYTHLAGVPDHAPPRTCARCGAQFLPVAPLR